MVTEHLKSCNHSQYRAMTWQRAVPGTRMTACPGPNWGRHIPPLENAQYWEDAKGKRGLRAEFKPLTLVLAIATLLASSCPQEPTVESMTTGLITSRLQLIGFLVIQGTQRQIPGTRTTKEQPELVQLWCFNLPRFIVPHHMPYDSFFQGSLYESGWWLCSSCLCFMTRDASWRGKRTLLLTLFLNNQTPLKNSPALFPAWMDAKLPCLPHQIIVKRLKPGIPWFLGGHVPLNPAIWEGPSESCVPSAAHLRCASGAEGERSQRPVKTSLWWLNPDLCSLYTIWCWQTFRLKILSGNSVNSAHVGKEIDIDAVPLCNKVGCLGILKYSHIDITQI